jgi:hypothetical protein
MLRMFPLMALSLLVYAALGLVTSGALVPWYERESLSIQLISGDAWRINGGHLFISFSMMLLFFELLRSTHSGRASIFNHALSVLVFIGTLLLFIMVRGYGNSIFFIFMTMTFLDFMAGFIITTVASRRDLSLSRLDD